MARQKPGAIPGGAGPTETSLQTFPRVTFARETTFTNVLPRIHLERGEKDSPRSCSTDPPNRDSGVLTHGGLLSCANLCQMPGVSSPAAMVCSPWSPPVWLALLPCRGLQAGRNDRIYYVCTMSPKIKACVPWRARERSGGGLGTSEGGKGIHKEREKQTFGT